MVDCVNFVFSKAFPCLQRYCKVAPSTIKSVQHDYIDVGDGVYLRVLRVSAAAVVEDFTVGGDDAVEGGDFWFNHWKGPHIVKSEHVRTMRRISLNQFGSASGAMLSRRRAMLEGTWQDSKEVADAMLALIHQLVDQATEMAGHDCVSDVISDVINDASGSHADVSPVSGSCGTDNPAFEPDMTVEPARVSSPLMLHGVTTDCSHTDTVASLSPHTSTLSHQHCVHNTKPLLFFIHGIGGSSDIWTQQVRFFSALGYECVAADLVGHGFSSCPDVTGQQYTFTAILDYLRRVFMICASHRHHVVVIGHSYGASFACALSRELSSVCLLVLLSCGGPTQLLPPSKPISLPLWLVSCLRPLLLCGFKSRELFYSPRGKCFIMPPCRDTPSTVIEAITRGQLWPEGDATFHKLLTMPTLLIYGMRDSVVSLVDMCDMEKAIPRAFLETIVDAGHWPSVDCADETSRLMLHFFNRWSHVWAY